MELQALLASEVALPSIPRVVALLLHELDQEDPDLRKVSQLISTDPALTARLLQLANSAYFHLSRRVNGVAEALALLGLNQVRPLVAAAAVGGAFKSVPGISLPQFWRYSLDTAKISRTLAGVVRQNQSAAFTAGLIHAVGELVLHVGMPAEMAALNKSPWTRSGPGRSGGRWAIALPRSAPALRASGSSLRPSWTRWNTRSPHSTMRSMSRWPA